MASACRAACLVLVSLALLQCAHGQTTAQQILQVIEEITTLSSDLHDLVSRINVVNVLFQGPKVSQGLDAITNRIYAEINTIQGSPPPAGGLAEADAQLILNSLKTFVEAQQRLLNVVIGKHGLLSLFFFTEPVRVALVSLEAVVDAFSLNLIAQIPTQVAAADAEFKALDVTLSAAITVYS